jgi:threonine/homoserine/homoserine lactone efflux protein
MNELYAFFFATAISLYGSMMAGIVNVNVVYTVLYDGKRHAKWMALGGVLPELLYSAIAIFGVEMVKTNARLFEILKYAIVPILIVMGIYYIVKKDRSKEFTEDLSKRNSFFKGIFLALLNPQLITFWFGWLLIADNFLNFESYTFVSPKITFVLGTSVGAYIMLRIFIYITVRNRDRIMGWLKIRIGTIIGSILIALGLIQLGAVLLL